MSKWRYWRNLGLFSLGAALVGLVAAIVLMSYQGAHRRLHPARVVRADTETPARVGVPYEDVTLLTTDGLKLAAWYTAPQNGAVILVAHGYGSARSVAGHHLFARHGYGVLSWDFRAHGESAGDLCTLGYDEALDVEAALDFALDRPDVHRVGAWGGSMGGAAVILAASRRTEIDAVIADSAFPSIEDELNHTVLFAVFRPFMLLLAEWESGVDADWLRPIDQIGRISPRPVYVIQGGADRVIPRDSAQRLYDAAGEPRSLWIEPGAPHVGTYSARPEEYETRVNGFFDLALLGDN